MRLLELPLPYTWQAGLLRVGTFPAQRAIRYTAFWLDSTSLRRPELVPSDQAARIGPPKGKAESSPGRHLCRLKRSCLGPTAGQLRGESCFPGRRGPGDGRSVRLS